MEYINTKEQNEVKNTMEKMDINNVMAGTETKNTKISMEQRTTVYIVNKTINSFYKMYKETRTMECLTCGKILIGVKPHNMKRHYRKIHDIDIQIGPKKKPPSNKSKEKNLKNKAKTQWRDTEMRRIYQKKLLELKDKKKYKKHKKLHKTECLVCGRQLSGLGNSIIKRHFILVHNIKLDFKSKKRNPDGDESDEDNSVTNEEGSSLECLNDSTTPVIITENSSSNMDKSKFLKLCVALIAIKGVSISLFDDHEIFKRLIAPQEEKFCTNLTSFDILTLLQRSNAKIRDVIRNKVKNKIVSLYLDLATGVYENALTISIQYIDNFKIHFNTLAIIQLNKATTDIKDVVLNCLESYEINKNQVYSYTAEVTCKSVEDTEAGELKKETSNEFENKTNDIEKFFITIAIEFREIKSISSIIQLTVANVLSSELKYKINQCRAVVRELQTKLVGERHSFCLDDATHWISTYKMLKSLLENRIQLDNLVPEFHTNLDFVVNIINILTPLVDLNNQLNNEQYTFGDFYRDWLSCEIELEELLQTSWYVQYFVQSMQKYKQEILKEEAFQSAIYLDPRFNFNNSVMLSNEQKQNVQAHLTQVYKIINTNLKNKSQASSTLGSGFDNSTQILPTSVHIFPDYTPSISSEIKCEPENVLTTEYAVENTDIKLPPVKQEEFVESVESTFSTVAYEITEVVEPTTTTRLNQEPASTSNKIYDKLTQRIMNLYAKPRGIDESLQSFKQKLIGLLSNKSMLPLNAHVLDYWKNTNYDADITAIVEAVFAVPVTRVPFGRASKCLDEAVIDCELLLTKYNFNEFNGINIDL
ncbi:uncharacterized protein [Eurosta solidaginis]|uniref:uncharacterized protein isoform X1 n=1 Tax=Eurosta solidaginis TaxID=178769 RepID=UPI0035309821